MKKRMLSLLLATVMVAATVGCGSAPTEPTTTEGETGEETAQETETDDAEDTSDEEEEYADFYVENTDITLEEIQTVNSPLSLIKEHESLGITCENYDANENLQSTVQEQYIFFEGKLWRDAVMTDAEGNNKVYYSDYEAEDTPGASYIYDENIEVGRYCLSVYPSDEYQYWIGQYWMADTYVNQKEEITDISTQDGAIIVQARTTNTDFGNYFDTMYYVDPDTRLVLYREDSWYDEEGTLLSIDRYTPIYDEPHISDQVAKGAVTNMDEPLCDLKVVFYPNQEQEQTQEFKVVKGTLVNVVSNHSYTLYSDAECTDMIDEINTDTDSATIYVSFND